MSYTLLELVDQVSGELGLVQPTSVIGSATNQTQQILALAQRLGKDLVRDFEWQRLVQAYIWQTQTAITTTGNITANSSVITAIPSTAGQGFGPGLRMAAFGASVHLANTGCGEHHRHYHGRL